MTPKRVVKAQVPEFGSDTLAWIQRISINLRQFLTECFEGRKGGKNTEVEHNFACKCYAAPARSSILLCLPPRCRPSLPPFYWQLSPVHAIPGLLSVGSLVGQLEINYERVGDNFVGFALRCAALLSNCAYDALHIAHKSHARLLRNCQFLTNFISLYTYIVV